MAFSVESALYMLLCHSSLSLSYQKTFPDKVFTTSSITGIKNTANTHPFICECYKSVTARGEDYSISRWNSIDTASTICINDSRYSADSTGASQLKSALNGVKLVYELATPIEIQLTPHEISLLKDYAYVSTNGTSIALDYHNGEIATLGDVAQVGQTIDKVEDDYKRIIDNRCSISRSYQLSSSNPIVLPCNDGYGAYLFFGMLQGVGGRFFAIQVDYGAVTITNVMTGASISPTSSSLTVAYDSTAHTLKITSPYSQISYISIIGDTGV